MTAWDSGYILANGIRLHYTRTGGMHRPLVLAHGFSDDGLCWTPVARALEDAYDVIMLDARGHGLSDAPESGYGRAELATDLAEAIRALRLSRPAVLGHSMGGGTALALAGMFPELPGAILIEDASATPATTRSTQDQAWLARARAEFAEFAAATREELIARCHERSPLWSAEELGPWADSKKRVSLNVLNRVQSAPLDWATLLPRITCPALLITADPERGGMVTAEAAREMQAAVPQLQVEHIAGAGHSIHREQFGRYMEVVRAFLAEQYR
jgi:N-formylmaleamate deformylase